MRFARCDCQAGVCNKLMAVDAERYPLMIRCSLSSTLSPVKYTLQDVNRKAQNRTDLKNDRRVSRKEVMNLWNGNDGFRNRNVGKVWEKNATSTTGIENQPEENGQSIWWQKSIRWPGQWRKSGSPNLERVSHTFRGWSKILRKGAGRLPDQVVPHFWEGGG